MRNRVVSAGLALLAVLLLGAGGSASASSIDKEQIRQVVRRHMNEIRFCYEKALTAQPTLEGRVTVQFTIERDGSVSQSDVQSSTLKHPPTETCITDAVKQWIFPKPVGGVVKVAYPFLLKPVDEAPAEPKKLRAAQKAQP